MSQHQCPECGYVYDSQQGDSFSGYAPGTPFAALPHCRRITTARNAACATSQTSSPWTTLSPEQAPAR